MRVEDLSDLSMEKLHVSVRNKLRSSKTNPMFCFFFFCVFRELETRLSWLPQSASHSTLHLNSNFYHYLNGFLSCTLSLDTTAP